MVASPKAKKATTEKAKVGHTSTAKDKKTVAFVLTEDLIGRLAQEVQRVQEEAGIEVSASAVLRSLLEKHLPPMKIIDHQ